MPYSCPFGCKTYNPLCDGCDSSTSRTSSDFMSNDSDLKLKAALKGMTLKEYIEQEDVES